jgi:hypothetical protein
MKFGNVKISKYFFWQIIFWSQKKVQNWNSILILSTQLIESNWLYPLLEPYNFPSVVVFKTHPHIDPSLEILFRQERDGRKSDKFWKSLYIVKIFHKLQKILHLWNLQFFFSFTQLTLPPEII